jgi:hypothetical protein
VNANQWYNLEHILKRLGERKHLLSGAQVKIDVKDRVVFKYSPFNQKLIRNNNGSGTLTFTKNEDSLFSPDGYFWRQRIEFPIPEVVLGKRRSFEINHISEHRQYNSHWKVYIDQETFIKVFLSVFEDNDNE